MDSTETKHCEFEISFASKPCGEPAHHEVVWYLWPFADMKLNEKLEVIPKWVWLCEEHYKDLQRFHQSYPPTHGEPSEDGPLTCTSQVPLGVSIRDVTVGR